MYSYSYGFFLMQLWIYIKSRHPDTISKRTHPVARSVLRNFCVRVLENIEDHMRISKLIDRITTQLPTPSLSGSTPPQMEQTAIYGFSGFNP